MTTLGGRAMLDVHESALKVVAAFKGDPAREHLNQVQIACLNDLEAACKFLWTLTRRPA